MSQEGEDQARAYGRVVARAWSDDDFKQRLVDDPAAAMREEGMAVPDGTELRVVETTAEVAYLVLPLKPAELSEEELDAVAGGQMASFSNGYGGYYGARP
jgi:hypothetical protein